MAEEITDPYQEAISRLGSDSLDEYGRRNRERAQVFATLAVAKSNEAIADELRKLRRALKPDWYED